MPNLLAGLYLSSSVFCLSSPQSFAEEQRVQGLEEADESRADQDCFSNYQCCLSISETLLKHWVGFSSWAGPGHCVTALLHCCVQSDVLTILNSDHWVNSYFLSKSYTRVFSLQSVLQGNFNHQADKQRRPKKDFEVKCLRFLSQKAWTDRKELTPFFFCILSGSQNAAFSQSTWKSCGWCWRTAPVWQNACGWTADGRSAWTHWACL